MLGAIIGDVMGSTFEHDSIKDVEFPLYPEGSEFTDDSILTIATGYAIMKKVDYAGSYRKIGRKFPKAGWGSMFNQWLLSEDMGPYDSYGNGSAMRVSPIGWAYDDVGLVLSEAAKSAAVSHNHAEGIKGAQAIALTIFLAREGKDREEIRHWISTHFDYDLDRTCFDIRPDYEFDVSCQGSVPEAIIAFLDSDDFESAVRLAISLGGDSDTLGCMTGAIAEAYYKEIPMSLAKPAVKCLPKAFKKFMKKFYKKYEIRTKII